MVHMNFTVACEKSLVKPDIVKLKAKHQTVPTL